MMNIEKCLDEICRQINDDGFYAGIRINVLYYGNLASNVNEENCVCGIMDAIEENYGNILKNPVKIINPHNSITVIYKVYDNSIKAYPICYGTDIKRFFNYDEKRTNVKNLNGIALVSHKLKMLSFIWLCQDVDDDSSYALWTYGDDIHSWLSATNYRILPELYPNSLHYGYKTLFNFDQCINTDIYKYNGNANLCEICLSIEDHYRYDFLREKCVVETNINDCTESIEEYKNDIKALKQTINECKENLKKYEIDLYASRIDADLNNII